MKHIFRLRDYGVLPSDGMQTASIQRVIDRCAEAGGGEVLFDDGSYKIAGIRIKSGVTLRLSGKTRLLGSDQISDYVDFHVPSSLKYLKNELVVRAWNLPEHYIMAPIVAFDAENVGIVGEKGSVIDGADCYDPEGEEHFRGPHAMVFSHCRNVTLQGYTVERSANWAHQIDACNQVEVTGITVLGGHDGINVHHCRNVRVEDCVFRCGDDCVAGYDVENLVVRGCVLNTSCSAFRIGGRNILVEKCDFQGGCEYPHRVSGRHNSLFAFLYYAIFCDDCGDCSVNWLVRDCRISNYDRFMFYDRVNEEMMHSGAPLISARFENVAVTGLKGSGAVRCAPGERLKLEFSGCSFEYESGRESVPPMHGLEGVSVEGTN